MNSNIQDYLIKAHPSLTAADIDTALTWSQQPDCHLVTIDDPAYPLLLKETADPPLLLYVRGDPALLAKAQIAMVGSRQASPLGLRNAEQFAYALANAGYVITSGLAKGIDGASHRGALRATGRTIAVMGTGQANVYPPVHQRLADQIAAEGGAVITEFPLHTAPLASCFPRRNRIIAGLALGVLVVEAALRSGSLITARQAAEAGREVFALPGSIHHVQARGCHYLIRQGAKLVETAADIVEELGALTAIVVDSATGGKNNTSREISPEQLQLLEQIEYAVTPLDEIILLSGLTASKVSSILLSLELCGYVQSVTGGYMRVGPT